VSHFFRLWLWLTTGMRTREWVAVHRKHHAKCETAEDPHSPQILGINRVLWGGVFLYVKTAADPVAVARYGQGTPDDWLERNVYSKYVLFGLTQMGVADVLLFGILPGALIFITQIVWISGLPADQRYRPLLGLSQHPPTTPAPTSCPRPLMAARSCTTTTSVHDLRPAKTIGTNSTSADSIRSPRLQWEQQAPAAGAALRLLARHWTWARCGR
jgi:hypothetical protein